MKINEKNLYTFANSKPVDKEGEFVRTRKILTLTFLLSQGYLQFKRDQRFHKRWFVLKGNMLFYFDKKGDKEPLGLLLLEGNFKENFLYFLNDSYAHQPSYFLGCTVELSAEEESQQYCFKLVFFYQTGEIRSYFMAAENQDKMESWMKAITCASYDYMKLMVSELRRQLEEIDSRNKNQTLKNDSNVPPKAPPRRQNPFNKPSSANLPSSSTITTAAGMRLI